MLIRRATTSDLPAIAELVRLATERSYDDATVARMLSGLEESECMVWIGVLDGNVAGLTALEIRDVNIGSERVRAGYWTSLFIRGEYRNTTLYPRLVRTMLKDSSVAGLALVYGGIRRRAVAEAHMALGMQRVGEARVMVRPLRPGRLIAKHLGLGSLASNMASVPDEIFRRIAPLWRYTRRDESKVALASWSGAEATEFAALRSSRVLRSIAWRWDRALLERRFSFNPDGDPYHLVVAKNRAGAVTAGLVFRMAVRGNGVRTGVILDSACTDDALEACRGCLAFAEREIETRGGDAVLQLETMDRAGSESSLVRGYVASGEVYVLLCKALSAAAATSLEQQQGWHFAFADHDAF
jgi:N-acetylglutamate synthase-like GNAT family acetyltransferase